MTQVEKQTMLTQRRILGSLCILLGPCVLLFGLFGLSTNYPNWYDSISDTYFCNAKMFNIGLLIATSIYFFAYKGYDKKDRIVSLIEAICSLAIVVFPCNPHQPGITNVGLFNLNAGFSQILHSSFAVVLFIAYAFNVTFLFTLGKGEPTKRKKIRNIIYYALGVIIWIGIILQAVYVVDFLKIKEGFPFTMINEIVMLVAFGTAYLIKSEAVAKLNDE